MLHAGTASVNSVGATGDEAKVSAHGGPAAPETLASPPAAVTGEDHSASAQAIGLEEEHAAHNYHPLPVVVETADGAWVTDVDGRRYLDCLAAYSAVNFGHGHPALIAAAKAQLDRVTLTSRAFYNDQLGPFVTALAELANKDMVLPMNTGAEAVESGIKVARAWGYRVKGVAKDQANIIVARCAQRLRSVHAGIHVRALR